MRERKRGITGTQRSCGTAPLGSEVGNTGVACAQSHAAVLGAQGKACNPGPAFSKPLQCLSKHLLLQKDISGFWDAVGSLL